jgi:hypothetical protein
MTALEDIEAGLFVKKVCEGGVGIANGADEVIGVADTGARAGEAILIQTYGFTSRKVIG